MNKVWATAGAAVAFVVLYLLLWPVPIDPVAWDAPQDAGLLDPFGADDRLSRARAIELGAHAGPEDVTAGPGGDLYATSHDGTLLRIRRHGDVEAFVELDGRPLGIEADADGSLVVANAFIGLQRITADASVTTLLDAVGGRPLVYADDVAIAADGTIYFSEASTKFGAEQYGGTYAASLLDIMEHGAHGRVIEYRADAGTARVIVDDLNFANGVAISADQNYLLIAETGSYRILKHWLRGPAAGKTEVLIDNLPGFPDNINNAVSGGFWVGLVAPRNALLDELADKPLLRKIVQRLPASLRPTAEPSAHVFAIDGNGDVLMNLRDPQARFAMLTGVFETGDALYLTSLFGHQLGVLQKDDL
ncbi:MAG: SMP-30/gluconolactonase/LRE family protein [Gammaproteobacteria bacterium]|nr:SMP-30/gluconolactonase/LRE family protein [Gammaproteobacteria bacterium]